MSWELRLGEVRPQTGRELPIRIAEWLRAASHRSACYQVGLVGPVSDAFVPSLKGLGRLNAGLRVRLSETRQAAEHGARQPYFCMSSQASIASNSCTCAAGPPPSRTSSDSTFRT